MQNFKITKREMRAFEPTGTKVEQNLSMSIAHHLGRMRTITYEAKDFPYGEWPHHLAYKELRKIPKFNDESPLPPESMKFAVQQKIEGKV